MKNKTKEGVSSIIILNINSLFIINISKLSMQQTKKQRIMKDLLFLTAMPSEQVSPNLIKRIEKEGFGETIGKIAVPFDIYISYDKFSYEGKILSNLRNAKAKLPPTQPTQNIPSAVSMAVLSMKLSQKAWFNAKSFDTHLSNNLQGNGCHYYITIEGIKYKHNETLQAKKLVVQRNKQQGRKYFKKRDYNEAMKKYKTIINISEGLQEKKFNKDQLTELSKININGKRNFMKCFCKIKKHDKKTVNQAEQYADLFWRLEGETEETLYFKGYSLMHSRSLTAAIEIAKKLYVLNKTEGQTLFDTVRFWMKKKPNN